MKPKVHATAGALALLLILSFWTSTLISELFLTHHAVAATKTVILYGVTAMVPLMALAGATGASLGKRSKLPAVTRKSKRMKIIATNGILVLIPSAIFLAFRAQAGLLDTVFYAVQVLELCAGAVNIALLSLNMRDGLQLARRRAPSIGH